MTNLKRIMIIVKSIVISYIISLILMIIYALLLSNTSIPESTMPTCTLVISLLSVFLSSSLSMINLKDNGMLNGAMIGLIFSIISS